MKLNKIIAIALVATLVLSLCIGCKSNEDLSSSSIDATVDSSTVYGDVDIVDDEANDTTSNDSNVTSGGEESSNASSNKEEKPLDNNYVSVGDGGSSGNSTSEDDLPPTYIESAPTTSNPDKNAPLSTADNPLVTSPNAKGKVVTVEIKAGTVEYYKIGRASNKVMTINSPNAYVIYEGVKYTAKNGVLSFEVVSDLLASEQISFQIGNSGSKAESFTILFTSPAGSKDNPKTLDSIGDKVTTTIKKGNDHGVFHSYKATQDGKIRFYIISDAKIGKLTVDKLIDPKNFIIQQRNTTDTGEDYLKTDSIGTYVEFDVKSGDNFAIGVAAISSVADAGITVEWKAVYA